MKKGTTQRSSTIAQRWVEIIVGRSLVRLESCFWDEMESQGTKLNQLGISNKLSIVRVNITV